MANDYQPRDAINGGTATLAKTFAAGFANATDLRAQSLYPTHCPQRVIVTNNDIVGVTTSSNIAPGTPNTSTPPAAQDFVYKDAQGNTVTTKIPQQQMLEINCIATQLLTSGAAISVVAFWWVDSNTRYNP